MSPFSRALVLFVLLSFQFAYAGQEEDTDLLEAVQKGDMRGVESSLKRGASLSARTSLWETPLHLAVAIGNEKVVAFLIERKADLNERDTFGQTPLHIAVVYLVKYAPDPKKREIYQQIAFQLVIAGADVRAMNNDDASAGDILSTAPRTDDGSETLLAALRNPRSPAPQPCSQVIPSQSASWFTPAACVAGVLVMFLVVKSNSGEQ